MGKTRCFLLILRIKHQTLSFPRDGKYLFRVTLQRIFCDRKAGSRDGERDFCYQYRPGFKKVFRKTAIKCDDSHNPVTFLPSAGVSIKSAKSQILICVPVFRPGE